jgi:hypothetical protein
MGDAPSEFRPVLGAFEIDLEGKQTLFRVGSLRRSEPL